MIPFKDLSSGQLRATVHRGGDKVAPWLLDVCEENTCIVNANMDTLSPGLHEQKVPRLG